MKAKFSNPLTKLTDSPVVPLMSFLVDIDTFRLSQIIGKSDTKNRALDAIPLITHNGKTQSTSVWTQFGIFSITAQLLDQKMVETSADLTQGQSVGTIES